MTDDDVKIVERLMDNLEVASYAYNWSDGTKEEWEAARQAIICLVACALTHNDE